MRFHIVTIFPDFFRSILEYGLLKRALDGGQLNIGLHDLRDYTSDRHRTVDDRPFGGGPGMVFTPEPIFRAVEAIKAGQGENEPPVILLSPQGRLLNQEFAEELSRHPQLVLICGRYEGVDERVAQHLATDEISIGDYILSGGELAAAVLMECITRLIPGVLGNEESAEQDSFGRQINTEGRFGVKILDCPHYTRPAEFRGFRVPEALLSGDHSRIKQWRRRRALEKTWRRRPELLAHEALSEDEERFLRELEEASAKPARS